MSYSYIFIGKNISIRLKTSKFVAKIFLTHVLMVLRPFQNFEKYENLPFLPVTKKPH